MKLVSAIAKPGCVVVIDDRGDEWFAGGSAGGLVAIENRATRETVLVDATEVKGLLQEEQDPIGALTETIRIRGKIPAVRVSSAQANGRAKNYSYWGPARYTVALNRYGKPALFAEERAPSARRVRRLAEEDARALAAKEGRVYVGDAGPGCLREHAARAILRNLREAS